jgi:predicted Fe-Mo cluster-binding NifX family protein
MKVCVPSEGAGGLEDRVGEHFGRVPTYTVVDTETGQVEVLRNESEHTGGTGLPGGILVRAGVDVVLCTGLGARALALLEGSGIEVCTGASGTVREAIESWKRGELGKGNACRRHLFHDHGH